MATKLDFIEYVCGQIDGAGAIRHKKMFGEYMVYVNDKPLLLVCNNTVYVKIMPCLDDLMATAERGFPYDGAKEHYILDIDNRELVLSPICVSPDYFNRGIAREMAEKSFEIAKELGYKAVFLCGEPKIYNRLGFMPTYKRSIYHVWDKEKNADWCMVRELADGALDGINGTIDIV